MSSTSTVTTRILREKSIQTGGAGGSITWHVVNDVPTAEEQFIHYLPGKGWAWGPNAGMDNDVGWPYYDCPEGGPSRLWAVRYRRTGEIEREMRLYGRIRDEFQLVEANSVDAAQSQVEAHYQRLTDEQRAHYAEHLGESRADEILRGAPMLRGTYITECSHEKDHLKRGNTLYTNATGEVGFYSDFYGKGHSWPIPNPEYGLNSPINWGIEVVEVIQCDL